MVVAVITVLLSPVLSSSVLLSLAFFLRVLLLSSLAQTLELEGPDTAPDLIPVMASSITPSHCADPLGCYSSSSDPPSLPLPTSLSSTYHSTSNPMPRIFTLLRNTQTMEVTIMPVNPPVSSELLSHDPISFDAPSNVSTGEQMSISRSEESQVALNDKALIRPHLFLVALSPQVPRFLRLPLCSDHHQDLPIPCSSSSPPLEGINLSVPSEEIRNQTGGTDSHDFLEGAESHTNEAENLRQTSTTESAQRETVRSNQSSSNFTVDDGRDNSMKSQAVIIKANSASGDVTKGSTPSPGQQPTKATNQTTANQERKTRRSIINYLLRAEVNPDAVHDPNQKKTKKSSSNRSTVKEARKMKSQIKFIAKITHPTLFPSLSQETHTLTEAPAHQQTASSKKDVDHPSIRNLIGRKVKMFSSKEDSRGGGDGDSRRKEEDMNNSEEINEDETNRETKRERERDKRFPSPTKGRENNLSEGVERRSESQPRSHSDALHSLHVSPFIPDLALNDDDSPANPSHDRPSVRLSGIDLVLTSSDGNPSGSDDIRTPTPQSFTSQGTNEHLNDVEKTSKGTGREAEDQSRVETREMDESLPVRPSQAEEGSDRARVIQSEASLQVYETQTSDKQDQLVQGHGKVSLLLPANETKAERGREVLQEPTSKRGTSQAADIPLLDTEGSVRIPCYVIIFLLGMIGNTLVIVTLLQNRKMRTITNVFLLNLAFSDLLLGVFCMPFTLIGSLLRDFIFGAVMCRLIPYFQAVSVSVSVWTLVAISLERFYAICQPLKSRGWQTLSHAYKIISIVWLLSLVFMAPIAVLSQLLPVGNTSRHKCREMWPSLHFERGFSMFLGAALLLVPLVIMVAAYSSIIVSLWHGMRLERETGQGTEPLISLTDLNGLAMVQQSLRRKQSRRHVSKISIRFRKIPAQTKQCVHCGRPEGESSSLDHASSPAQDLPQACLHERDCENYKWRVESVRESTNGERRREAARTNTSLDIPSSFSPCRRRPTKPDFKRLRSTHLEKSIEAKKHVIRMLFVVVLEFFLCWTPIFVVNIMCLYMPEQVYRSLGSVGISFLHLLSYASSCCNPITYCFMNKKFLQGFRYAFGCRKEAERNGRKNGTAASFRSQSNNIFKLATEVKRDARETTV